ncbi:hypothetical protein TL16_g12696 [Triparma laevis f. inornata]|uniref:Uncharacterized protein n=1 Tax=Triparma laevis f. inornata TaxID=1714386 RepID=A0A9W7BLY4_9STRA|nr:hypothetical protein TL16_g12696 [Triparma laevis f. inornata]
MQPAILMKYALELYSSFNPKTQTLDSYLSDTLGDCDSSTAPPSNITLKQILYSVVRFKPGIAAFLKHYFYDNAGSVLRADYDMYAIMLCLCLFRIEDIGFEQFSVFCMCEEPTKMAAFLGYLFDTSDKSPVQCSVKQEWCKHYDVTYIEKELIAKITSLENDMKGLINKLVSKAQGMVAAQEEKEKKAQIVVTKSKGTVPVPFNITKPRPRRVPEPIRINNDVKVGNEPDYLDRTSLEEIEAEKAARLEDVRLQTRKKYEESKEQPFKFHETRSNIDEVRREIEERREAELQFDASHRKPLPDFKRFNATVKLNAAAILREDALFKKKQAEEAKLIQNYEEELRDSTEFYRWRNTMEEHDHLMKMEQVKSKRMQAVASAQNAKDAKYRQFVDNKAVADLIKEEGGLIGQQRVLEKEKDVVINRQLVKEIKEVEEKAPRKAEAKVFRERQQVRKTQKEELHEAWEKKLQEDEVEQRRKMDKIMQLRTHIVHKPEVKVFDPTTCAGLGLLDEMSLVEMEERLKINQTREKNEEMEKRRAIIAERSIKQAQLSQRINNIKRIREAAKTSNMEARQQKKMNEKLKAEREEQALRVKEVALAAKLMEEREERKMEMGSLMDEEERRKKNQMFQGAATHQVEETHYDQLLLGREREAKQRKERAQSAALVYEQTKVVARNVVEKETRTKVAAKKKLYKQKDDEIKEKRQDLLLKNKAEVATKKYKFAVTRQKEKEIKAMTVDRNVYAQTINDMSLTLAKTHEARRSKNNVANFLMSD